MQSNATSVEEYINELPEDRKIAISALRKVFLENMPKGLEEGMAYGHINYFVPYSLYEKGYHCPPPQPLPFAGLGSQKNHMAAYLFCLYVDPSSKDKFVADYIASGKKLDMGAGCVRFKKLEQFPLEVLANYLKTVNLADFIDMYDKTRPEPKGKKKA